MHWKVIVFFLFLVHIVQTFNGDRFYINLRPHLSQTHSQQPLSFSSLWELMLWNSRGLFSGALCISAHALGEKKDKPRKSRIDFSHLVFPKHFSQSSFCRFYLSASWRPATLCYASGGGQPGVLRCGPFAGLGASFCLTPCDHSYLFSFFFTQKLKPYQSCDESVYRKPSKKKKKREWMGIGNRLEASKKKRKGCTYAYHTHKHHKHTRTHTGPTFQSLLSGFWPGGVVLGVCQWFVQGWLRYHGISLFLSLLFVAKKVWYLSSISFKSKACVS